MGGVKNKLVEMTEGLIAENDLINELVDDGYVNYEDVMDGVMEAVDGHGWDVGVDVLVLYAVIEAFNRVIAQGNRVMRTVTVEQTVVTVGTGEAEEVNDGGTVQ